MYAKYHSKGFNIISVSSDKFRKAWVRALDQENMPWTQVIDVYPSKDITVTVSDLYGTHYIPYFVLINKKGEVIIASGDEKLVTKKIEEILAVMIPTQATPESIRIEANSRPRFETGYLSP